jgi:hypothetical protein
MYNFCIAMNIYTTSQIEGDVRAVREFHNWLLVEILTTMSTILGAMWFLMRKKCCGKGHLVIQPDGEQDETQDYMGNQINLILLLVELQAWVPMTTNVFLLSIRYFTRLTLADDASIDNLFYQCCTQLLQLICYYCIFYISMRFHKNFGVLLWFAMLCFMIFIPIWSIVHYWYMAFGIDDFLTDKNQIKAWVLVYPLMGLMNILFYFL